MAVQQINSPTLQKPLRLWPGIVFVALLWLARFGLKLVIPGFEGFSKGMMGGLLGMALIVLWWLFLSRAPWVERVGAIVLMAGAVYAVWNLNHESMGPLWLVGYAIPVLGLSFVVWAVATRHLANRTRRLAMVATILLASGGWTLARTDGINGDHVADFDWRWSSSPEVRLLVRSGDGPTALPSVPAEEAAGDAPAPAWPGFRGPARDGVVPGVRIATDWSTSPPVELWRQSIGPGWSSFAVRGDLFYTQEQLGDDELVSCHRTSTGEPVWQHRDPVRFFESNAGAGPRSTPTLSQGRVYTVGATGIVNALDAHDGSIVWSRDLTVDAEVALPDWGFSSSPLIIDDLTIVAAGGRLVAYDALTGEPRWLGPARGGSYSSPHSLTIDGVEQILLLSGKGATSLAPTDGTALWEHSWPGFPMVQPARVAEGELLVSAGEGTGLRRLAVTGQDGHWSVEERWTSLGLKPYFNDFVVHEGHAFGFDGRILSCIDLENGERKWKGGRYGSGQLVLLPDQDLLLVLSEKGEIALVEAKPQSFTELARIPAIEGKTWNHPVLARDILLARNGREMVAFRLPLIGG